MKRILFLSLAVIFTSCFEGNVSDSSDDSADNSGQNISQTTLSSSSSYVSPNVILSSIKSPIEQPVLTIQNPSFEENLPTICEGGTTWSCPEGATIKQREAGDPGIFGMDKIDPWEQCSGTPDLLPNAPNLRSNITASDGDWYVGLVCDNDNIEAFGQYLSAPFTADVNYSFQVDLAHTMGGYNDGNAWEIDKPGILKIYGSKSSCDATEQLLWQSPPIDHADWKTYEITFTPTSAWSHIHITTAGKTEAGCEALKGNILLDNIGNFVSEG
jgi:hypothetical protein